MGDADPARCGRGAGRGPRARAGRRDGARGLRPPGAGGLRDRGHAHATRATDPGHDQRGIHDAAGRDPPRASRPEPSRRMSRSCIASSGSAPGCRRSRRPPSSGCSISAERGLATSRSLGVIPGSFPAAALPIGEGALPSPGPGSSMEAPWSQSRRRSRSQAPARRDRGRPVAGRPSGAGDADRRSPRHGGPRGGRRRRSWPGRDPAGSALTRGRPGRPGSRWRARRLLADPYAPRAVPGPRRARMRRQRRRLARVPSPVRGRRRVRGQEHRPRGVPPVAAQGRRPRDGAGGTRPGLRGARSPTGSSGGATWT